MTLLSFKDARISALFTFRSSRCLDVPTIPASNANDSTR